MAFLLAQSIAVLFIMIFIGYILVKTHLISHSASQPLSILLVYAIFPCAAIVYFEVDYTDEVLQGLLLAFAAALVLQLLQIGIVRLLREPLGLNSIDQASAIYSNCGNLIIPLIISTLGEEWVIYSLAFICVSTVFTFTHGQSLVSEKPLFNVRAMRQALLNPSIIAIGIGLILFFTGWRLPGVVNSAVYNLANMLGATAMLIAGIGVASTSIRDTFANKRVWRTSILRLVVMPLLCCAILKFAVGWCPIANASSVLLITLLAAAAPCASSIVQFAAIHEKDDIYASSINVVSTLCCIITMPLIIALFQL